MCQHIKEVNNKCRQTNPIGNVQPVQILNFAACVKNLEVMERRLEKYAVPLKL